MGFKASILAAVNTEFYAGIYGINCFLLSLPSLSSSCLWAWGFAPLDRRFNSLLQKSETKSDFNSFTSDPNWNHTWNTIADCLFIKVSEAQAQTTHTETFILEHNSPYVLPVNNHSICSSIELNPRHSNVIDRRTRWWNGPHLEIVMRAV